MSNRSVTVGHVTYQHVRGNIWTYQYPGGSNYFTTYGHEGTFLNRIAELENEIAQWRELLAEAKEQSDE